MSVWPIYRWGRLSRYKDYFVSLVNQFGLSLRDYFFVSLVFIYIDLKWDIDSTRKKVLYSTHKVRMYHYSSPIIVKSDYDTDMSLKIWHVNYLKFTLSNDH